MHLTATSSPVPATGAAIPTRSHRSQHPVPRARRRHHSHKGPRSANPPWQPTARWTRTCKRLRMGILLQKSTRNRDQCLSENVCMELDPKVLDLDIMKNMNKNLGNVSVLSDFWPMEMKSFSCENASNYTCHE